MRTIKFRCWEDGEMINDITLFDANETRSGVPMQFTGLLDNNGLQEVYEGDIIDEHGNIKGNTYEMDKGENDLLIQGFGTSAWSETEKKGLERGLKYS